MTATTDTPFLDVSDEEYLTDPHPTFDCLRASGPVVADHTGWSTLDYATSAEAFMNKALLPGIDPLLATFGIEPLWGTAGRTLSGSEAGDHRRLRRVVAPWFTGRRVEELRDRVQALSEHLLAERQPGEPFDVMADYADVVPSRLFCWMIGAPESEAAQLARLSKTLLTVFTASPEMVEPVRAAKLELSAFTSELIARRRADPGDDIISLMLADVSEASVDETGISYLVEELLSASVDNTANTTALAIWTLLRHPVDFRRVGDDPTLVERAVEECGRFEPAIRHATKYAASDTTLGDVDITAGEFVSIRVPAAQRDPAMYDEPHRFDIDRDPPKQQLAFGLGRHFCLGAALGRMEINEMVRAFAIRRPDATVGDHIDMDTTATGLVHRLDVIPGALR